MNRLRQNRSESDRFVFHGVESMGNGFAVARLIVMGDS